MSFASPRAILRALLPGGDPSRLVDGADTAAARVAAFRRFVESVEARGGGEPVPEFPASAAGGWLNVRRPLTLSRDLRGKVVVLDFWTYCCVNCMHVLPDLARLERRHEGEALAVVGVHSAKFDNERDPDAVRNAVIRYDVSHPVVSDGEMALWRGLGVSSWPTQVVVSPSGRVLAVFTGEGHARDVEDLVSAALGVYGERGELDASPLPVALERERDPRLARSPLRYPGGVAVDGRGGRLFVSDSNNHRVVATDLGGRFLFEVGGNGPGLRDGGLAECALNRPQGLAYDAERDVLYVADTENHALRLVVLSSGAVTTLLGDGSRGGDYVGGRAGRAQRLNSPWDVAIGGDGRVFVAMAGSHQVWSYDPATGEGRAFAGDGYERNRNGASGAASSFAQPSGLAWAAAEGVLYVADSESSSVRSVRPDTGATRLRAGGDALIEDNLFQFGDQDGAGGRARLQHPLAVAALPGGQVLVADSYNHRLKVLDPATNAVTTVAGSGTPALRDGAGPAAALSEPGGLAVAPDGTAYVADTNNNAVRVLTGIASGRASLRTLELSGVPRPRVDPATAPPADAGGAAGRVPPGAEVVSAGPRARAAGARLSVTLRLPDGYHLTRGANSGVRAYRGDASAAARLSERRGTLTAELPVPGDGDPAGDEVQAVATVYYCRDEDVCLFKQVAFVVGVAPDGDATVALSYDIAAPQV